MSSSSSSIESSGESLFESAKPVRNDRTGPVYTPLYSALGALSPFLKSGSSRVVTTRTYPTPPHIKHLPIVLFTFLYLDVENRRVFAMPLPPHASHLLSKIFAILSICTRDGEGRRVSEDRAGGDATSRARSEWRDIQSRQRAVVT